MNQLPDNRLRHTFGLFDFFSKYATFELFLVSNDENKFQPIFQIQHIKNAWCLLELDMALVTTIELRFAQVCLRHRDNGTSPPLEILLQITYSSADKWQLRSHEAAVNCVKVIDPKQL